MSDLVGGDTRGAADDPPDHVGAEPDRRGLAVDGVEHAVELVLDRRRGPAAGGSQPSAGQHRQWCDRQHERRGDRGDAHDHPRSQRRDHGPGHTSDPAVSPTVGGDAYDARAGARVDRSRLDAADLAEVALAGGVTNRAERGGQDTAPLAPHAVVAA